VCSDGCVPADHPSDDADERLVRFARVVSHGMRNPLAIATGMLDLVHRQAGPQLDDDQRDLLRRSSEAMRRAADQLLQLQRFTRAFRDELRPDDVDLDDALAAASDGLDPDRVTVARPAPLPHLRADRGAVVQVLRELLDNAVRHATDDGPVTVTITATDGGDAWQLAVADDGPGIPADQRAAAMVEGERLGRTGDGFGLGLPTVRILVSRHGGDVRLDASDDGGLLVELRWPKVPALLGQQGAQR
jgi:two-component system, chemotaxis family, sensor kinase Cph1